MSLPFYSISYFRILFIISILFCCEATLVGLILLPFWINFRYCTYPVALHERLLGWIPISCECLLQNEKERGDGLWNLIWSPGGFCSVAVAELCLFSQLTNGIISSEFRLLLALSLQSFSLSALFFYIYLSISSSLVHSAPCTQGLKQHG